MSISIEVEARPAQNRLKTQQSFCKVLNLQCSTHPHASIPCHEALGWVQKASTKLSHPYPHGAPRCQNPKSHKSFSMALLLHEEPGSLLQVLPKSCAPRPGLGTTNALQASEPKLHFFKGFRYSNEFNNKLKQATLFGLPNPCKAHRFFPVFQEKQGELGDHTTHWSSLKLRHSYS